MASFTYRPSIYSKNKPPKSAYELCEKHTWWYPVVKGCEKCLKDTESKK